MTGHLTKCSGRKYVALLTARTREPSARGKVCRGSVSCYRVHGFVWYEPFAIRLRARVTHACVDY